jgi:hypothetical protein
VQAKKLLPDPSKRGGVDTKVFPKRKSPITKDTQEEGLLQRKK